MDLPAPPNLGLTLHHIGIVVTQIDESRSLYDFLGYEPATPIIHDPIQTAYVRFLRLPGADHYIELVAPDSPDSLLAAAAAKKQPLNHLCYATPDIVKTCELLQSDHWRLISEPTLSVAFSPRKIAWLISPTRLIIELVEQGPPGSL
jgi:methylmalonyl-CoA/ethylmalonyl-CoA epimerase